MSRRSLKKLPGRCKNTEIGFAGIIVIAACLLSGLAIFGARLINDHNMADELPVATHGSDFR